MDETPRYWFRAKRNGWGWGPPRTWQGWVVLAVFFLLLGADALLFPPDREIGYFLGLSLSIVVGLLVVVWRTGEPPRWRWGGD